VPEDPPPVLEICANAAGFDGTLSQDCVRFSTGETELWEGTLRVEGSFGAPYDCSVVWTDEVQLTVEDGVVSGSGESTPGRAARPTGPPAAIAIAGSREADALAPTHSRGWGHDCDEVFCLGDTTGAVPVADGRAQGTFTTSPGATTFTTRWRLRCTSQEPRFAPWSQST
jgi:hypothetical protein